MFSHISAAINLESGDEVMSRKQKLLSFIEENIIGRNAQFKGPFGKKRIYYCDFTASGRPLKFIEDFISQHVSQYYANTHTTTTITSKQTTRFRADARNIIKKCVNASDEDVVIFTGSGSTGAIHKLVNALEITTERAQHTAVLVGPFEHHSNILPWKESGATVVRVKQTSEGLVDLQDLEQKLQIYSKTHGNLLGCFSAASNVTGILTDTYTVSSLLHKYNALAFWDYATAAPYLEINMNPSKHEHQSDCSKDAVFVSTHKFVGGPGSPGVLIAKKKLFINRVPHGHGGGTVQYVSRDKHHYTKDIESREEGGTPAIIESIRAGLVFQLKDAVTPSFIAMKEEEFARRAFARWQDCDNLVILGSRTVPRLPIFSFLIRHPESGKYLHHNFITVLLNDLFGIQSRGGCACAGPYAHDLLGITEENAETFFELIREDRKQYRNEDPVEGVRPGFVRINLPYFASDETIEYIMDAVQLLSVHGWKMLPQYRFSFKTGAWTHRSHTHNRGPGYQSLHEIKYDGGYFEFNSHDSDLNQENLTTDNLMEDALYQLDQASVNVNEDALNDPLPFLGDELNNFVWFLQPREAAGYAMAEKWQKQLAETTNLDIDGSDHLIVFDPSQLEGQKFVISHEEGLMQPYIEEVGTMDLSEATVPVKDISDHLVPREPGEADDDTAVVPGNELSLDFYSMETNLYSSLTEEKMGGIYCDETCSKGSFYRSTSQESGYASDLEVTF
ncbi:Cysteine desulfurase 1, chloroplastic [Holothuria leucospilota]|uniref:Cysteine desulfurase 1, chloroplastic n=1 Tax=Holothuria leucospilota TaxID=206669 RepID=A0A9Q1H708_HOLLE|nr:Cysteine desulfurase 1, chloroplastic [Holothuria leucospilota]